MEIKKIIPYGRQNINDADIEVVINALKGDFLTQGPKIYEFETAFAQYVGAKYAVALSNGTAALHLCAMALDVNKKSNVITTPITFAASANCIRYCGGNITFVDIDPNTILLDTNKVEDTLKKSRKKFQGIVPVDFAGNAVHLEELRQIADKYGLWIIEDACHAPGGSFLDSKHQIQKCGNGNYADLAIFSFHPVKHIATGEGGMITTNDEKLYQKLLVLRTHGITRDVNRFQNSPSFAAGQTNPFTYPGWYMEMQTLGYNYRITDFQAALGLSQLSRADDGLLRRKAIAKTYFEAFDQNPFIKWQSGVVEGHAYHLYIIQVEDRLGLYNYLKENDIYTQIHYIPCHLMPYYKQFGWKEGDMPHAEKYYTRCISLPMYPTLTDIEQEYVIEKVLKYIDHV
jgi:UDP-4-amino-4,6-dideoxy-N-acetyl-beta-L-altrosamine transaminase